MIDTHSNLRIASLIEALGTRGFGQQFYDLFDGLLHIKQCNVFCFSRKRRPSFVVAEGRDEFNRNIARALANEYITWAFKRDPNCHEVSSTRGSNLRRPRIFSVALTDFKDPVYRNRFYEEPGLSRKLVLLGSSADTNFYINFYRGHSDPLFSPEDTRTLMAFAGVALQATIKQRHLSGDDPAQLADLCVPNHGASSPADVYRRLCAALAVANCGLTSRETEVCANIMLGYSTMAISLKLGVSIHTVATHRKRAYSKLGVSGQSGLFARYLSLHPTHVTSH